MLQDWFRKAKLGIFIHYGIYSVKGVSESWSFHNGGISYEDYMDQLNGFTAKNYDTEKWADLFVKAGAKYVVMTTKHHDGVALWDTKYSDLNVIKKTPAARDLVTEYTDSIRKAGMKVGLYYSLIDWTDERYRSVYQDGTPVENYEKENIYATPAGKPEDQKKWEEFLKFNNNQLTELMKNYGTIDLLWFDGDWERSAAQWKMPEFREFLHSLNPNVVLNSRMQGYGDYKTPEQGLPVYAPKEAWEFCTTINESWGYQHKDNHYKTAGQVIRMFCECLTQGGNMLLDIGPKEDGSIDPRQEEVLVKLGEWIHANEEAVYDSERGVDFHFYAGGSTLSEDKKQLYLFVYDKPNEFVCLKGINTEIDKITVLSTGQELTWDITGGAPWNGIPGTCWISLSENDLDGIVTVLKVSLKEPVQLYYGEGQAISNNDLMASMQEV